MPKHRIFAGSFRIMESRKKQARYQRITLQLEELLTKTTDPVARMSTIAAVLKHKFDYYFWCGFYRVTGDELTAGPYQGPVACQVLKGGGVCLESVRSAKTVIVPNVHEFPGHIACDSRSNSEIVVPVFDADKVLVAVLDVDSTDFAAFDQTDAENLEKICRLIYNHPA
jgi:GAF domain-containing protein